MSEDPRRLMDDAPNDLLRAMLEAAREEAPSDASMKRTMVAVGAGAAVLGSGVAASAGSAGVAAASTAKIGAGTTTAGLFFKWAGVGLATGLAAAGVTESVLAPLPTTRAKVVVEEKAPPAPRAKAAHIAQPTEAQAFEVVAEQVAPMPELPLEKPAPSSPKPAARIPRLEPIAEAPSLLAEEVRALDRARAKLAQGEPSQALSILDAYDRALPHRTLEPEALYLRAEALVELGDLRAAASVAQRLVAAKPHGPHARRARAIIEASSP